MKGFFYSAFVACMYAGFAAAQEFEAIADLTDLSGLTTIEVGSFCDQSVPSKTQIPVALYTLEPADNVTISTTPSDLITNIQEVAGTLRYSFNPKYYNNGTINAGVKIGMPADQLKVVTLNAGSKLQIIDGFTSVSSLTCNAGSTLTADLSSNIVPITLDLNAGSRATVKSGSNFQGGALNAGSTAFVSTPTWSNFNVNAGSRAEIDGDVTGATLSAGSGMTVTGSVSDSTLNAGSSANAGTCGGSVSLNAGSSCNSGSPDVNVNVEVDTTYVIQSSFSCNDWSGGGVNVFYSAGVSTFMFSYHSIIATVAAVFFILM